MNESASLSGADRIATWFSDKPWRILVAGVILALIAASILMYELMGLPFSELAQLVIVLTLSCIVSVGLGYLIYSQGWTRSSSLTLTLMLTYVWAAVVTLFNVWLLQRQMFFSDHDLILSGVLLLFAAIIATTYGLYISTSVTDGLKQLANAADRLAEGDLNARVPVTGRDEVARVSVSFNEMAGQLQATADRQRELEILRRNLIAWTSHDLRTPLTSIRARVEALHDGLVNDPEMTQRYYQGIRADVVALNGLIDDLFELAQLDAGGVTLEIIPDSLSDLVSDCLESFQALAMKRRIVLNGSVEPGIDPVWMNASKISRVVGNLTANAIRYTPDGGLVNIKATRADGGVIVTVRDSGPGFNEADLPFIFEQFYRGEQARSRATGGAGLGLAIARSLIQAHNGRIWAENPAEGGGKVSFFLPNRTEPSHQTT
jgi:signal transduction histidine kinase